MIAPCTHAVVSLVCGWISDALASHIVRSRQAACERGSASEALAVAEDSGASGTASIGNGLLMDNGRSLTVGNGKEGGLKEPLLGNGSSGSIAGAKKVSHEHIE